MLRAASSAFEPLEALGVGVLRPQRRVVGVHAVQVADQTTHAGVARVVEEVPVECALLGPLAVLRELLAHEQQLLARMGPLPRQEGADAGQLLPPVTGHLAQQRALAVHDLVVADRQHVVLGERVDHAERQLVVVVAAVDRIAGDVLEAVVHPAHVPLEAEAETVGTGRLGHARPGGGLLGDRDGSRHPLVDGAVELLEEVHRLEVLPATVDVGLPLARLAGVVEVEHRGHGVDADAVDVELLEPVERVGHQEVPHLLATEVEDERAPVGVLAAARVGVLVEGRAVEAGQRELVLGEVRRHPVDDDADACVVQRLHQATEAVGITEARGRRVVRRHLVAPGPAERVLHHRQQLDVGEPHLDDVRRELVGQLVIGERPAGLVLAPRTEVHLVDRHRLLVLADLGGALGHPLVVGPGVLALEDPGGSGRRDLGPERHRVGLVAPDTVRTADVELVARTRTDTGDEDLPDPGGADLGQYAAGAVPAVEVPTDLDLEGPRSPHPEGRAVGADLGAEGLPQLFVSSFVDEVDVQLTDQRLAQEGAPIRSIACSGMSTQLGRLRAS